MGGEPLADGGVGTWLGPVALQTAYQLNVWCMFQGVNKAIVSLNGGGGACQTFNLQDASLSFQAGDDVLAHDVAHLVVVGTNEGGVLLGIGLTLEYDDGDALVEGSVDGW